MQSLPHLKWRKKDGMKTGLDVNFFVVCLCVCVYVCITRFLIIENLANLAKIR